MFPRSLSCTFLRAFAPALVAAIHERGWPLRILAHDEWQRCLEQRVMGCPDHVLYPLLPLLREARFGSGRANISREAGAFSLTRTTSRPPPAKFPSLTVSVCSY